MPNERVDGVRVGRGTRGRRRRNGGRLQRRVVLKNGGNKLASFFLLTNKSTLVESLGGRLVVLGANVVKLFTALIYE